MLTPLVTFPAQFVGVCEDCGKLCYRNTEDAVAMFEDDRCKKCQAEMYQYMEATERLIDRVA